jgi:alpha-1,3-fucosyltransferase
VVLISSVHRQVLPKKKALVAAVISNCLTASKRERFIQELISLGIPVDIYGKCGNNVCAPGKSSKDCYALLATKYKFFLAFENSHCRDYVTEKMFEALRYPWVPIVHGGANYSVMAPPK